MAYRLVAEPRVVPRAVPRVVPLVEPPRVVPLVGAVYRDVGLDEMVLGGCSTKDVSVVLRGSRLDNVDRREIMPLRQSATRHYQWLITYRKVISPSPGRVGSFSASVSDVLVPLVSIDDFNPTACAIRLRIVPF